MAVRVPAHPMKGSVYRVFARLYLLSLVVGLISLAVLLIATWTGNGAVIGPVPGGIFGVCLIAFIVANSVCQVYYPRD